MIRIVNVTDDAKQRLTLQTSSGNVTLTLLYMPMVESWFVNAEWRDDARYGVRVVSSASHLASANWPFDIICTEPDGVDPYRLDDFFTGRCVLWYATPEEMKELRA